MSSPIDTDKIIDILQKENILWKQKVDDLCNRMLKMEQKLLELNNKVNPIPTSFYSSYNATGSQGPTGASS
jgi:hypothetical protein